MEQNHTYFPIFLDLREKEIQVFGGGTIAARRIETLLPSGAKIQVNAPKISPKLQKLAKENQNLTLDYHGYRPSQLEEPYLVLAATDDKAVNAMIFRECRHKGILVNNASEREQCDFFFPGLIREGEITVGVTANGKNHKKAAEITEKIREILKNKTEEPDDSDD